MAIEWHSGSLPGPQGERGCSREQIALRIGCQRSSIQDAGCHERPNVRPVRSENVRRVLRGDFNWMLVIHTTTLALATDLFIRGRGQPAEGGGGKLPPVEVHVENGGADVVQNPRSK